MSKIAVLGGGCSPEHDVSLSSSAKVIQHLASRHAVWPVYLDRNGRWTAAREALDESVAAGWTADAWPSLAGSPERPGIALAGLLDGACVDVVFPVLHGAGGEDGTVQGMLELHGIPFVGSGCAASASAMDKIRTRETLEVRGVPLAPGYAPATPLVFADPAVEATEIARRIGFPCFLKVDVSGSTLGVQRADGPADVAEFLRNNRGLGRRFLAEALVTGEEITVAVLGNTGGELQALPPVGIYPREDAYFTYEAKYTAALCEELVPPRGMDEAEIQAVQRLAVRCHEALCCDGMSRVDMIMSTAGPVVLEINTIPGLTDVSLLPRAAAAAEMSFAQLLDRLVELALDRQPTPLA